MVTTGGGLTTALAAGVVTAHPTTAPSTRPGGPGRAACASRPDAADTLCSSTPWCRYVASPWQPPPPPPLFHPEAEPVVVVGWGSPSDGTACIPHHCQVNEETGNRRPVMLTVQRVPRLAKPSKTGGAADSEREEGEKTKPEETQTDQGNGGPWLGNGELS